MKSTTARKCWLVSNGARIIQRPWVNTGRFGIWSAYSYLQSFEQIAREYLKTRGDGAGEQTFANDTLGRAYEAKGLGRPWQELAARAAGSHYPRGAVPQGSLVLTFGIDCQGDRVEWLLIGHGRQYRRFVIDYGKRVSIWPIA